MSLLIETSPKHCANRGFQLKKLLNKKLIYIFSTFISLILFLILLIYLILHPSKPQFYLKDTSIYDLALSSSSPHLLNSTIQVTLLSQNPNTKVGVYYDDMRAFAVYKGQQITEDSRIPSFYQGHQDTNVVSTSLCGTQMPVAASIGYEVSRDQSEGKIVFSVRVDGELKWKIGSWVSRKYRLNVDCVAIVGIRLAQSSVQGSHCSTNV